MKTLHRLRLQLNRILCHYRHDLYFAPREGAIDKCHREGCTFTQSHWQ